MVKTEGCDQMTEKRLYWFWAGIYVLCSALGFMIEPTGVIKGLLVFFSLLFFVPGAILLYRGIRDRNRKTILRIRWIAALSLGLTALLLLLNVLSVLFPEWLGNILYIVLGLVSAPMFCGQYWVLSLFLWASLMMATFPQKPGK